MRIEFKKQKIKTNKFVKFCEKNGADYYEDNSGVWMMPKKYGAYRLGVRLREYSMGHIDIGIIDESCMNFQKTSHSGLFDEEVEWLVQLLPMLTEWSK